MVLFDFSGEAHRFGTYLIAEAEVYTMPLKLTVDKDFLEKEYFEKGRSQEEIANHLGISQWVISQRMREFGLKAKPKTRKLWAKKYSVNECFFDELNPESAWVLGWIASDGFVRQNKNSYYFGIKLSERDTEIIYSLKKLLKFTGKVYSSKTVLQKTGKEYPERLLQISSKKIFERLGAFGIVPNKSLTLSFPNQIAMLEKEEISKAFIQGVFEGDGSIIFDEEKKSPCFQIVGTKEFLEGIQLQLIKYLGLKKTKLTRNTKLSNHFALRYRGRFQALKIFDWLYSGSKYYLKRKYDRYLEIKRRLS